MDDRPGTAFSYGGFRQEDEGICIRYPEFYFRRDPSSEMSTTTFAISDGSKTLGMNVEDFWVPRRRMQLTPNTGILHLGEQATLTWPVLAEALYPHELGGLDKVHLTSRWPYLQGTYGDHAVTVTIPSDAPLRPAQMVWQIDVGAPILRCDSASECVAIAEMRPSVDVNITP